MIALVCSLYLLGGLLLGRGLIAPRRMRASVRWRSPGLSVASALFAGILSLAITGIPIAGVLAAIPASWIPSIIRTRRLQRIKQEQAARSNAFGLG